MKLKTIIVEDEILGQEALEGILVQYCEEYVEVVDKVATVNGAIASINEKKPHLIFLDITLYGNENGAFDILSALDKINFTVIFTTSSNQPESILKAFNEFGAQKYLLKPLNIDDVVESVAHARKEFKNISLENEVNKIKTLINTIMPSGNPNKLKVPVKSGFQYVEYEKIIMIRSDSNNSLIFLVSGETISNTNSLKYYELELPGDTFFRVSKSYIVNIHHVQAYSKEDGGTIHLTGDCFAALSEKYSKTFFAALGK